MKKLIGLVLLILVILSCEDSKKSSKKPITNSTSSKEISKPPAEDSKKRRTSEEKVYPKLTSKNVVSFLTEYGKNNPETKVQITTVYGTIDIQLFKDTPLHRANFIYLVKQGYFNTTFFHRVVPEFIIQAGSSDQKATTIKRAEIGIDYLLPYEKGSGRIHKYGTVSGAKEYRKNPDNKSAPFEFFIFLGPLSSTSHLNGKYTIFGKVTKGMEVVEKIANVSSDSDDWPIDNIYLTVEIMD